MWLFFELFCLFLIFKCILCKVFGDFSSSSSLSSPWTRSKLSAQLGLWSPIQCSNVQREAWTTFKACCYCFWSPLPEKRRHVHRKFDHRNRRWVAGNNEWNTFGQFFTCYYKIWIKFCYSRHGVKSNGWFLNAINRINQAKMIQRTKIWTILTIRTNIAFSLFGQKYKTNNKIEQYCNI